MFSVQTCAGPTADWVTIMETASIDKAIAEYHYQRRQCTRLQHVKLDSSTVEYYVVGARPYTEVSWPLNLVLTGSIPECILRYMEVTND